MKKICFLLMSMLLLMLAGCSSDDNTINDKNILGYWESEATYNDPWGLLFLPDGEIKNWKYSIGTGQYSEEHWGYYWLDGERTLKIQNRPKDSEPNPDELFYKVMSLTKDRLVIRTFGGIAGIPIEKGTDVEYKKIDKPGIKGRE